MLNSCRLLACLLICWLAAAGVADVNNGTITSEYRECFEPEIYLEDLT